jgi:putative ABC transport system ATP-binding protein
MPTFTLDAVSKWRTVRGENAGKANAARRIQVLRGISLSIPDGRMTALIGPSGAGKSTLLRLLNRLEDPDEGRVLLDGTPVQQVDVLDLRRRVAMVFQQPALFEGTVAENVAYGPCLRDAWCAPDTQRVGDLLRVVGLPPDYAERNADQLSVGEQQRVAIARALANEPEVLLLDEPTSALDPGAARRVLAAVRDINASLGLTVVMVSHAIDHARAVAQRVVLLVQGEKIEEGDAEPFFREPATDLARRFLAGDLQPEEAKPR